MMNNIFKNAYFDKAYKTRDGRKAILVSLSDFAELSMELDNPPYITSINVTCNLAGKIIDKHLSSNQDIISEWQEEINEAELSKLAWEHAESMDIQCRYEEAVVEGFKAGYRKAKELC